MAGQSAPRTPGAAPAASSSSRSRRPTMADVADRVGVSRALVSIVFRGAEGASEDTRKRVLEAAAEIGYRPDSLAQGLRRSRSRNLGVLFSLRRPFEVELVEHMLPLAKTLGYDLLLGPFSPGREQDDVIDELLRYRSAGIVVVGPKLHARDLEPLGREVALLEVGRDCLHRTASWRRRVRRSMGTGATGRRTEQRARRAARGRHPRAVGTRRQHR